MKAILDNPYRIAGLLAGATAKEQEKHISHLKMYVEADQDPPQQDDYSFPVLGKLTRTINSVTDAESKLVLDSDKMNAALFWFYKGNETTDEWAFESLKGDDIDTAYQIWNSLIVETKYNNECWQPVTEINYSAFHNYFVVEMLRRNGNKSSAIICNLNFLENDLSQKFVSLVTDSTFKITTKELQTNFLNSILHEIEKKTINLTSGKLMTILNDTTFAAKADFLKSISQKVVAKLTAKIEVARNLRTTNKADAAEAGETLYRQGLNDLLQLKSIVETKDFTYSNIADKAANEILQCGIDYFNYYHDTVIDPGETSMKLFNMAKRLVVGTIAKQRCQENITKVQEWIDDEPERVKRRIESEKQEKIAEDLKYISDNLQRFKTLSQTKNNNKWYDNPKDWDDFGGWWCTKAVLHVARGSSVNQGCGFDIGMVVWLIIGWLILIPFNLLVGIIYVLYLFVAWIMRNTSNDK